MLYLTHLKSYNLYQYNLNHIQEPEQTKIDFFSKFKNKKKKEYTLSDVTTSTIPIGMNVKPIIKKTGNAVLAVIIGCHAGKRCCLKAVSTRQKKKYMKK
jgi:hypothetical protein